MSEKRRRAIRRRRIFLCCCVLIPAVIIAVIVSACNAHSKKAKKEDASQSVKTEPEKKGPEMVQRGEYMLNADYSRLILVNAQYPLPEDYDYDWNITEFDVAYSCNTDKLMHRLDAGVWPYMKAMIEAARSDGVELSVWSPYRTYEMQERLFKNRVAKENGDEAKAAQSVARPGTSEHHTGLCADMNMASDRFENTPEFAWLCEHAGEYGFILRYPSNKTDITAIKYESWHWRFVGINAAKEINNLNMTLEEYIEYKGLEPQAGLYDNASPEAVQ